MRKKKLKERVEILEEKLEALSYELGYRLYVDVDKDGWVEAGAVKRKKHNLML